MLNAIYLKIINISKPIVVLVIMMLCVSSTAIAAECEGETQLEMRQCASAELEKLEQEMNSLLEKLNTKLDVNAQQKLDDAKQSLQDYRKKQCAFESSGSEGGTVHSMVVLHCYTDMTHEYIKRLKLQLQCEEGNLSCVR